MPRSLFTAVAGLQSNQTRMDVIADNVANVNTTGFKTSRMEFSDSFSQTLRAPTSTQPVGIQIGLGNTITSVTTSFLQGAFQRTDVQTDMAISGNGFFVVQDPTGVNYFTRDGAFTLDSNNALITPLGYNVRGAVYTVTGAGNPDTDAVDPGNAAPAAVGDISIPKTFKGAAGALNTTVSYSIGSDGKISVFGDLGATLVAGFMTTATFSNPQGLEKKGNSLYQFNSAAGSFTSVTSFSGTADVRKPGTNSFGTIQSGALELSNVDLASQFTDMIVTQRGFDANARVITTTDEMLQTLNTLKR